MLDGVRTQMEGADALIFTAAVADYRPAEVDSEKIKREKTPEMNLRLVANPDIAATISKSAPANTIKVGFALETGNALEYGRRKLETKGLDMIVVNSLEDAGAGFGTDTNKVTIIRKDGSEIAYPLKDKREVARDIVDNIVDQLT